MDYGFVTMVGGVRCSLGSVSAAGTFSGFGLVAGLRRGGEGLGRSSEADGVSVVKTADRKRTRVDWECCIFVALMLLLMLPTVSEEPLSHSTYSKYHSRVQVVVPAGNCWKRGSSNPLQKTVFRVSLLQDIRA